MNHLKKMEHLIPEDVYFDCKTIRIHKSFGFSSLLEIAQEWCQIRLGNLLSVIEDGLSISMVINLDIARHALENLSSRLYRALVMLTKRPANKIIKKFSDSNGFEVYRLLVRRYGPKGGQSYDCNHFVTRKFDAFALGLLPFCQCSKLL